MFQNEENRLTTLWNKEYKSSKGQSRSVSLKNCGRTQFSTNVMVSTISHLRCSKSTNCCRSLGKEPTQKQRHLSQVLKDMEFSHEEEVGRQANYGCLTADATIDCKSLSYFLLSTSRCNILCFLEQIGIEREDCGSVFPRVFAMEKEISGKIKHALNKISGALYCPQNDVQQMPLWSLCLNAS